MHHMLRNESNFSRRSFLRFSGLAAAAVSMPGIAYSKDHEEEQKHELHRPLGPQEFRSGLAGPILSLPTTFNEDLTVNHQAIHQMVGRAIRYHVPIVELTAGNSKYACLEFDEIKAVTRSMAEAVDGQAITIAATGAWPTDQVIDYASYSKSLGIDALQILLPEGVKDEDELFQHFVRISKSSDLPLVLHGEYSNELLARLAKIDSIVAMKEDGQLTYFIDRAIGFGDRFEIFSGGAENRFLVGYPYGSRAFFATYTGFAPDKPMLFWDAIRKNDLKQAVAITKKYDYPFISRFTHPFWHATLEYFGVAKRYLRKPFETMPDSEIPSVKEFFDAQGIDPNTYQA